MPLRRLLAAAVVSVAATGGLSACTGQPEDTAVHQAATEGIYVTAGALKYQVQISRVLNPYDWEDREYLHGIAPFQPTLGKDEDWFGVFIRVFNITGQSHQAASEFKIVDTTGTVYKPVSLDPQSNPIAYAGGNVLPKRQLPLDNTLGRTNPTQGGLVLFKIPAANFSNRPLEFVITAPDGGENGTVQLDV